MNETEVRMMMINIQKQYLGMEKNDEKNRFLVDVYNDIKPLPRGIKAWYGTEYCALQQSAISQMNQFNDIIPVEQGVWEMMQGAIKMGIWKGPDYTPQVADFIIYDWPKVQPDGTEKRDGAPDHVGIVEEVHETYLVTIEGNVTGGICARRYPPRSSESILGFITPHYEDKADHPGPGPQPTPKPDDATDFDISLIGNYTPTTALYEREHPRTLLSKIIAVMRPGDTFVADGYTNGHWFHGSFSGIVGWTSSKYLKKS